MNTKIIDAIQNILDKYIETTNEFYALLSKIKDKEKKKIFGNYVLLYVALNMEFVEEFKD